jgi:hypothetical protein
MDMYKVSKLLIKTLLSLVSQFAGSKKDQAQLNEVCHSGQSTTAVTQVLLQHHD